MNNEKIIKKIKSLEKILSSLKNEYINEQIRWRDTIFKSIVKTVSITALIVGLIYSSLQIWVYYEKKHQQDVIIDKYKQTSLYLYRNGENEAAISILNKILEINGGDDEILMLISNIKTHMSLLEYVNISRSLNANDYKKLQRIYGEITYLRITKPTVAEPYLLLSLYYIIVKDIKNAELNIKEALKLAPSNPYIISRYAYVLMKKGIYSEANNVIEKALLLDNSNKYILHINALIKTKICDYNASKIIYEKILEKNPRYAPALYNLAFYYLYRQKPSNPEKAMKLLLKEIELYPNNLDPMVLLGGVFQQKKDYENALLFYNYALKRQPDLLHAIKSKAIVYRDMGKYDDSLSEFKKLIEIDPINSATYYVDIAWEVFRVKGDPKQALYYINIAEKYIKSNDILHKKKYIVNMLN